MYQVNNSATFNEKPVGSEEFLNRMVEALGIIIGRRSKERTRKMESQTIGRVLIKINRKWR